MRHDTLLLRGLAWLCLSLVLASPASGAQLQVTDASTGEPLADAVVEVLHPGTPSAAGDAGEVMQRDAAFVPRVSVVAVDSRVSFPNRDTTRHHVFSFSPAKVFDLELYLQETPPPVTFDQAGVVVLGCNIHDHMRAFIVVSNAPRIARTGADGRVALPGLPAGRHALRIWHPRLEDTHQQWWEGQISRGETRTVALDLEASLPVRAEPSALQERFRQALQDREGS
ncbi:methylamine utilization protein [Halomonas sp. TRM85114]|uniref:methylamine utilization protein n=1 Tax=Halomonas jincaotanensis TaxID=2810616 RepID=UPI001BD47341|nr:methylamine utilization protein [Halomonas jincaotanensis]MBS9403467.1 methylamine utilization protein [Halomonas jincaotanensis]